MQESSSNPAIDPARPVRAGEELDLDRLAPYLRRHLEAGDDAPLAVDQFPSGYSNLTYLLRLGAQELVLRRPPFGNRVKSAHDMGREFRVLSALEAVYPAAPRPLLYCDDEDVLGAPFYIMERRRGVILRQTLPPGVELPPVLAGRLCEAFVDQLAALHSIDAEAAGLGDLGRPDGYVERQVRGWIGRYEKAQTDAWPELDASAAWLIDRLPAVVEASGGVPATLVHNDFKYDNLVLDPNDLTRIVAVLDWEMATLGDPRMDLGTTLAYWVEAADPGPLRAAAFGPTAIAGSLGRETLAGRWSERTGIPLDEPVFFYVFGLYKLAVIVQQIFYRFAHGHTRDQRFGGLDQMVGLLGKVAAAAIERGRLSPPIA
ncbi:MAG: phosphotransferase family protein [Acidobacteriota bacterium]